jgi:hypothetical protein
MTRLELAAEKQYHYIAPNQQILFLIDQNKEGSLNKFCLIIRILM